MQVGAAKTSSLAVSCALMFAQVLPSTYMASSCDSNRPVQRHNQNGLNMLQVGRYAAGRALLELLH